MTNSTASSDSQQVRHRDKGGRGSPTGNGEAKNGNMKRATTAPRAKGRKVILIGLLVIGLLVWAAFFSGPSGPTHSVGWWDENVALRFGLSKEAYAVVLDAGSTGTRVLAFAFHQSLSDNNLKLKNELFQEVKPGLSSYAENPEAGAESVKQLLAKAKVFIPQDKWASTPIALKATAGLRLLPKDKADAILNAVSNVIRSSGFHATDSSVGIMDGVDEGIFSWFTVNFLLGMKKQSRINYLCKYAQERKLIV